MLEHLKHRSHSLVLRELRLSENVSGSLHIHLVVRSTDQCLLQDDYYLLIQPIQLLEFRWQFLAGPPGKAVQVYTLEPRVDQVADRNHVRGH